MKFKTGRINNYVGNILQVTKDTIKHNQIFYDYYINKDNNLYKKQLPILVQKYKIQALAIKKKENIKNSAKEDLLHKTSDSIDKALLSTIRNTQTRSKNLPPLCPFYNEKGELLRSVVATSKVYSKRLFNEEDRSVSPKNIKLRKYLSHHVTKDLLKTFSINFNNFQNDYFYEQEYDSLNYNDSAIFGKREHYLDFIKTKIKEFKKSNMNATEFKKEKLFDKNVSKKLITLNINSLKIKIYKLSKESNKEEGKENKEDNKPIFEYDLPFQYLPLFYYKGEEKFKIILSQIIKYDNTMNRFFLVENPEKIIKDILNYSLDFQEEKKQKPIIKDIKKKPSKDKLNLTMGPKKSLKNDISSKYSGVNSSIGGKNLSQTIAMLNPNMYVTNVDENKKKVDIISQTDLYPNKNEYDFINYNIFEFFWLTENHNYKITINTPLIKVIIPKNKIYIKKFIDFELLFYLIENNFLNWDFYIIKYLASFKKFRTLLEKINSIKECFNKNLYLTEPKIKNYSFYNIEIINIATVKKREFFDDNIIDELLGISENKEEEEKKEHKNEIEINNNEKKNEKESKKINNLKEKDTSLNIVKKDNVLFIQKSFMALVRFLDTKTYKSNDYRLHFNYNQFQKIQKMENYIDKISFLIKFINIDDTKKVASFDYKSLDNFDEKKWIKNFNKYNTNYLKTISSKNIIDSENKKSILELSSILKNNVIQIEIFNPILSVKMLSETGIISNAKILLNNNYLDNIISIDKDNILELSNNFYECFEKGEKNKSNKKKE